MGNGRGERALGGGGEGEEEARAWWRVAPCAAGCMRRWGTSHGYGAQLARKSCHRCVKYGSYICRAGRRSNGSCPYGLSATQRSKSPRPHGQSLHVMIGWNTIAPPLAHIFSRNRSATLATTRRAHSRTSQHVHM